MNEFLEYVSSKLTGISFNYDEMDLQVFLKLHVLLTAEDTLFFSEIADYMQNSNNATLNY